MRLDGFWIDGKDFLTGEGGGGKFRIGADTYEVQGTSKGG